MSDMLRKQNRMMNCPAVTAGQIPYRNVTVKDKLDELDNRESANTFGTAVDFSSYTSNNKYTCNADGYAMVRAKSSGSYVLLGVGVVFLQAAQSAGVQYLSIYVKKGMQIWIDSYSGTFEAYFYSLEGSALPSAESEGF